MEFYKYWKKAGVECTSRYSETFNLESWGWSNISLEDAQKVALERAQKMADKFNPDEHFERAWDYYPNTPVREEVMEEGSFEFAETTAKTTINAYGAKVLNCSNLPFVDIDFPRFRSPNFIDKMLNKFFGKPLVTINGETVTADVVKKCERIVSEQPEMGIRLYRTHNGLRVVVTSYPIDPTSDTADSLFQYFSSDKLYVRLCKTQKSYRARLTPKYYRVQLNKPTYRYPFESDLAQTENSKWQKEYTNVSEEYSTCRIVGEYGSSSISQEFKQILEYHDRVCKIDSNLPLA